MFLRYRLLGFALVLLVSACGSDDDATDSLRINEMQVVGSHNSYHIQPGEVLFGLLADVLGQEAAEAFEYTHVPLEEQFESQGVRQIELDIFWDPDGGLYESPVGLTVVEGDDAVIPGLDLPGFKVLHVQEVDYETTCGTLIECLENVKRWSDAHPHHVPITILIEAKDDEIPDPLDLGFLVPPQIGAEELDLLDVEIRSVFPESQMITPDDVRGDRDTLEEAVLEDGWPTLGQARGKVLFALDNGGGKLDAYVDGHPALRGRVLFTSSPEGSPEAGFMKINNAIGGFDRIQRAVAAGYIVRTRADSPEGREARDGDTMRRDVALASGAQFVSTDYPVENPDFGTGYAVQMPGGMPVRCNPISAPETCTALALEDPDRL